MSDDQMLLTLRRALALYDARFTTPQFSAEYAALVKGGAGRRLQQLCSAGASNADISSACTMLRRVLRQRTRANLHAIRPITSLTNNADELRALCANTLSSRASLFVTIIAISHVTKNRDELVQMIRDGTRFGLRRSQAIAAGSRRWCAALTAAHGVQPLLVGVSILLEQKDVNVEHVLQMRQDVFGFTANVSKAAVLTYHLQKQIGKEAVEGWFKEGLSCKHWPKKAFRRVATDLATFPGTYHKTLVVKYIRNTATMAAQEM